MSAFVVEDVHINLMVKTLIEGTRDAGLAVPPLPVLSGSADALGRLLLAECERSVGYRYSEPPGDLSLYHYADPGFRLSAAEMHKAIHWYEYQSCEHPEWEQSAAFRICEAALREIEAARPEARAYAAASVQDCAAAWPDREAAPWGIGEEWAAARAAEVALGVAGVAR